MSSLDTSNLNQNGDDDNYESRDENDLATGSNNACDLEDDDEEEEDDDDKIKIVIGEISKKPYSPTRQLSKPNQLIQIPTKPVQTKGVDLDAQGLINEVPTLDFDLQGIKDEDKPWRKPGMYDQ